DPQGYFFLPDLAPGFYSLNLQAAGYHDRFVQGIQVQAGDTTDVQVALEPLGPPVLISLTEADGDLWQLRTYRDSLWRWQEIPLQRLRNLSGGALDSPIIQMALQPTLVDTPRTYNVTRTWLDSIVLGDGLVDDFESGSAARWRILPGEPGSFLDTAVVSGQPGEGGFVLQLSAGNEIARPPSHQLAIDFQPGLALSTADSLRLWIRGEAPLEDPTRFALDYYPLHMGDVWHYRRETWEDCPGCHEVSYWGVRVRGDTLMPNGLRYVVLKFFDLPDSTSGVYYRYQRIDSTRGLVLEYQPYDSSECTADSLFARTGDTLRGCNPRLLSGAGWFQDWFPDSVLGLSTFSREFRDYFSMYRLSKGLGLTHSRFDELTVVEETLLFARINGVSYGTPVGISPPDPSPPPEFQLFSNYPNPFNPETTIRFQLPGASRVVLRIYDLLGRRIATLFQGQLPAGVHQVKWDGRDRFGRPVPSGVYITHLQAGNLQRSRKMVLVR
ncbi:MAG: T9SS C-terminal target domain-containing protein, partial [Calditrichaeota bacterium]